MVIPDAGFYRDLAYVFVAAVLGGLLARISGQPLILGYVVGGILISPLTPGPSVRDIHTFELFAEIGVILLMFSIGIEFSLRDLVRVKWVAVLGGPLGIVLSIALALGAGALLGWPVLQSIVVGMVVSVASTMVLARLLMDRGELQSRHGRIMIGITLVEDLAVVVLIVLIPRLGALEPGRLVDIARGFALAAAILVPFFYLASRTVPALLARAARLQSQELFMLVALAIALGTAALTQAVGLSLALGAFLAGLLISQSDYAHEALLRLLPLRDAFVALFFVTMGAVINPAAIVAHPELLGVLVALIVVGKLAIWTAVVWLFRHRWWTAVLVGIGLTQIGEFSFILVQVARRAGHVGDEVYQATLAASLLTILANAALIRTVPRWLGRVRLGQVAPDAGPARHPPLRNHVVICGFGRVGSSVGEALDTFGVRYAAIETNPDIIAGLRARGVTCVLGDAAERAVLEAVDTPDAALVIVALPDAERGVVVVREARSLSPTAPILARAHHPGARDRLVAAGASEVIQPEFEAASTLIRHALRALELPRDRVLAYLDVLRKAMEATAPAAMPSETALPELREVAIGAGGLADESLRSARIRERFGVTVVVLTRADGDVTLHPSADAVMRAGDRLVVFGRRAQVAALERAAGSAAS
ncbi:MAG: cation:proton antiporter [Candidatus Rokubacteria bacterium]|nr:cation:proton antiporter [Candidatus Rokubacteria bacterium]